MVDKLFDEAGAQGFLYVREVGGTDEVAMAADAPVVLASVVKVIVAVAFARAVVAGELDPAEVVTVPARYQVGGAGTAGCSGPVTMTLADLALFMLTMSDNAATDVIFQRVGHPAVNAVVEDLGLHNTHVRGDIESVLLSIVTDLALPEPTDVDDRIAEAGPAAVWALSCIDPARTNASTARDIGTLLEAIWTDRAAPPRACALVRSWMSQAFTTHGLAAAFPDGVKVAAKTGTLPAIRNEAGVVTYPDGRSYVVAAFTRAHTLTDRQPAIDVAIGAAARAAVDHLRAHLTLDPSRPDRSTHLTL
ncbi:serine hydrolase [Winogradskya humida]|nr:serine hydrolase [Actinoplanes humidus]